MPGQVVEMLSMRCPADAVAVLRWKDNGTQIAYSTSMAEYGLWSVTASYLKLFCPETLIFRSGRSERQLRRIIDKRCETSIASALAPLKLTFVAVD